MAQWIEDYAAAATKSLAQRERKIGRVSAAWRSMFEIQAGLGRFFGAKFRAGVLYRIYEKTGDRAALEESLAQYRQARAAWAELANRAKGVYMSDITVGEHPQLRGHWLDRLPAIDRDIAAMEKLKDVKPGEPDANAGAAIKKSLGRPDRAAPRFATILPRTSAWRRG